MFMFFLIKSLNIILFYFLNIYGSIVTGNEDSAKGTAEKYSTVLLRYLPVIKVDRWKMLDENS